MKADFERPFSMTQASLLCFNSIIAEESTAHTSEAETQAGVCGMLENMLTTGLETRTVSIERLTVCLGAAQSQGVASLGFLSCLSLGAIVIAAAHVVSHMGSWARTGRKGSFTKPKL